MSKLIKKARVFKNCMTEYQKGEISGELQPGDPTWIMLNFRDGGCRQSLSGLTVQDLKNLKAVCNEMIKDVK